MSIAGIASSSFDAYCAGLSPDLLLEARARDGAGARPAAR